MQSLPKSKEEANEFLRMVEWREGKELFGKLKTLAESGEPTTFSVTEERYPKAFMMICAEMDDHSLTFFTLFKKLTELWSDGKMSLSSNFGSPGFTFHLVRC